MENHSNFNHSKRIVAMNNIIFVKTPSFVVNANGKLSDSLRPDESKGQRLLKVESKTFESLKLAMSWINKEGQKKSTTLFLHEIRPAAHGAYNVRFTTTPVKNTKPANRPNNTVAKNAPKQNNAPANRSNNRSNQNKKTATNA